MSPSTVANAPPVCTATSMPNGPPATHEKQRNAIAMDDESLGGVGEAAVDEGDAGEASRLIEPPLLGDENPRTLNSVSERGEYEDDIISAMERAECVGEGYQNIKQRSWTP